jgi:hypothetical protein
MKQLAKNQDGECLSDHYINAFTKLHWRCAKRHEWEAPPSSVKNKGTWCPICGREIAAAKVRLGLDEMHQLAKDRGGACLSNTYPKKHGDKLLWRCHEGHEWEATPSTIKHNKQWCPICASGYSERLCRAMCEAMFNQKFPKSRPSWLRNSCNKSMELDGYCKELNLAFEYHGIQHYKEIDFFHRKTPLDRRRKDDETKRLLCKQNYVTLIEIPYTVKPEELQEFIYSQSVTLGITAPRTSIIKLADLDYYSKNRLEEMHSFAVARGGECLADHYVTIATPVKWRCQKSHEWETAFHYIKNKGQWCPMCAKSKEPRLQGGALKPLKQF